VERAFAARACARSARLHRADWLELAMATADFLRTELFCDGDLYATFQDGAARHRGYLDDVAFLLAALLELMQAGFRRTDLDLHACLAARCSSGSRSAGGRIFFTGHDHEPLFHRAKRSKTTRHPAAMAWQRFALLRLAHLTGDLTYGAAAERTLNLFHAYLRQSRTPCRRCWRVGGTPRPAALRRVARTDGAPGAVAASAGGPL